MKIALIGYGKMGKTIEKMAEKYGHEIVARISLENMEDFTEENIKSADVAIEFTAPESAYQNLKKLISWDMPTVSGSTGWLENLPDIRDLVTEREGSFIYSSNYSLGVNIFFHINEYLAQMMEKFPEYEISITETHHKEKLDQPSGTSISIANQIIEHNNNVKSWKEGKSDGNPAVLGIKSKREEDVPGTHSVLYKNEIDEILIQHTAFSRKGFAMGAIRAAEYICDKKGIFTMDDVLHLHTPQV